MPRFVVQLNGRGIRLTLDDGSTERGGFFVPCVVEAPDEHSAAQLAVESLRAHPKFLQMSCWPTEQTPDARPAVVVESIARLNWWQRRKLGVSTGFVLYPGPDEAD